MQSKGICVEKVGGKSDLADGLPKCVERKDFAIHVDGIGLENRTGRHTGAPGLVEGDAVKAAPWADDHANRLECDDPGWNDTA